MKRILTVEDQRVIRHLICLTLRFASYDVLEASDGAEALVMARQRRPDLILLDIMLPGGISGLQVCRQLRLEPQTRLTPVLIMTSLDSEEDRLRAHQAGATAYMVKPFRPMVLLDTIEGLLQGGLALAD